MVFLSLFTDFRWPMVPNELHLGSLWAPFWREFAHLFRFGSQAWPGAAQRLTCECFLDLFVLLLGWILNTFEGTFCEEFSLCILKVPW